jgi:hypothetical protein
MSLFRAVFIAALILATVPPLFFSELNPFASGEAAFASSPGSNGLAGSGRFASLSQVVVAQNGNGDNGGSDNGDNGGSDNGDNGGSDNGSDNGDNGGGNGNGGGGNGNGGDDNGDVFSVSSAAPPLPGLPGSGPGFGPSSLDSVTTSECLPAYQESAVTTGDQRITVRVFPSMPQALRITIRQRVDPTSVPFPPGRQIGDLLFNVLAESCDGQALARVPAEINLGINYSEIDSVGLNEPNFTIARLDPGTNQWRDEAKQAVSPPTNSAGATILDLGFFVLYERPA